MNKIITFAIPSYNSENYLHNCVDHLLTVGDDCEIIIVDDGSKDKTGIIGDEYANKYPNIVRVIHKENGGHGSGVNRGLAEANGLYYKVVDSDDWLDVDNLKTIVQTIKEHIQNHQEADLYIANFIYDRVILHDKKVASFEKMLPVNKFFTWKEIKRFKTWHLMLMHALIYKTEVLKKSQLRLPEHTFYVDNIVAYQPLPYAKKLYYFNLDLYHYYIGRADQSVTIENIVKRYDQQIRVMNLMLEYYTYEDIMKMDKPLRKYMFHNLSTIMNNTCFFTTAKDTKERRKQYKEMWSNLKQRDKKLYKYIRHHTYVMLTVHMPWKMEGFVTTQSYKFACKHLKLGF